MKQFVLSNDQFDGFFKYMRLAKNSYQFITAYSETSRTSSIDDYCSQYASGGPTAIIDGDDHVAWCNSQYNESQQQVIIDIGPNLFILETFVFLTACGPPKDLEILGSNNNITFHRICRLNDVNIDNMALTRTCQEIRKPFRFFKIKQHGKNTINTLRLHIREIEFFGILNPLPKHCQYSTPFHSLFLFSFVFLPMLYEQQ